MQHKFLKYLLGWTLFCSSLSTWAFQAQQLVNDARSQIGKTLYYDPSYTKLSYPLGDVEISKGVCTDVVVRALRVQGIVKNSDN